MAKWGTYPPDKQLRLKRDAAEELYEALVDAAEFVEQIICAQELLDRIDVALAKARGEMA